MIEPNASQHLLAYRLSRRSMLLGLAGFSALSAFLASCGTASGNPAGGITPTIVSTITIPSVPSPAPSSTVAQSPTPAQSPTTIPASGPIGTTLYEYQGHTLDTFAVAWSPDGTYIASGSFDKTVQVWSTQTGETRLVYRGHTDQVNDIHWSPDGKSIASSGDGTVQVWDASTGRLTFKNTGQVYGSAWSSNSTLLAFGNGTSFQIWNVATSKQLASYSSVITCCPVWSRDGKFIAAYGFDDAKKIPTLQIWGVATQRLVFTTDLPNSRRSAIAWSPDSSRLAFSSSTGLIESWEMPSGQHLITYPVPGLTANQKQWLCLNWSYDGRYLAAGSYDGPMQIWNAQTTAISYTNHANIDVQALAWSPNRPVIASCEGNIVRLWQAA
ncbi:MAG TPA: WD40 repeat domain-containing protein [Ktedonobacteraceae bacterium]|nr:WD40 repeat domain-containing protein [Ktedonobacteraceae bacterium]